MKRIFAALLILATSLYADDYRTFTASDGRTLEARLLYADSNTGKIQIQRKDGKKLFVTAGAFSEADQKYIKQWEALNVFQSTSKFKVIVKKEELSTTEKEHTIDFSQENTGRRGGGGGIQTIAKDEKTKYVYRLLMENKSGVPLSKITMEYRVYYKQQKAVIDEKANQNRPENSTAPDRHKAIDELKIKDGSTRLKSIGPKETGTADTDSVTLLERKASRPYGDKINLKSDLSGVWIKLTMRGPDGEKIVREIASPESVKKKFLWDQPEEEPEEETEDKKKKEEE